MLYAEKCLKEIEVGVGVGVGGGAEMMLPKLEASAGALLSKQCIIIVTWIQQSQYLLHIYPGIEH